MYLILLFGNCEETKPFKGIRRKFDKMQIIDMLKSILSNKSTGTVNRTKRKVPLNWAEVCTITEDMKIYSFQSRWISGEEQHSGKSIRDETRLGLLTYEE